MAGKSPALRLTGRALLNDPAQNKGTAFDLSERQRFGLDGLLPTRVESMPEQCARLRHKFDRLHDDLERHVFLRALQDTNQTLFYGFVEKYLTELLPILYTPTVGLACQEFSHIYRRPLGLFISYPNRDQMDAQFASLRDDVDVVVVTDGERILGLGDQGLGGMGIPIGKLSLYTTAGGVDPRRTLPVLLDVGTNNQELLDDPLYLGWRHERIIDDDYDEFVEQFVETLVARFPQVLLQWEDIAGHHATPLLHRYRDRVLSFNDDIQGTAAVALAAIHAAVGSTNSSLSDHRICIVGAGSAGSGIAAMLADALIEEGVEDVTEHLVLTDARGVLHDQREDLADYQQRFAQPFERVAAWADGEKSSALATLVDKLRPTAIIGVSGQGGIFTQPIIEAMAETTDRPIVMPLSNPTSHAEALPSDLIEWTDGRALIATGSPFEPVAHNGVSHVISQANNIYVFPGIGQGALISNATQVTDSMLRAAARGVADESPCLSGDTAKGVLPPLNEVAAVSRRIALAVARAARIEGVGDDVSDEELERRLNKAWWTPQYRPLVESDAT